MSNRRVTFSLTSEQDSKPSMLPSSRNIESTKLLLPTRLLQRSQTLTTLEHMVIQEVSMVHLQRTLTCAGISHIHPTLLQLLTPFRTSSEATFTIWLMLLSQVLSRMQAFSEAASLTPSFFRSMKKRRVIPQLLLKINLTSDASKLQSTLLKVKPRKSNAQRVLMLLLSSSMKTMCRTS